MEEFQETLDSIVSKLIYAKSNDLLNEEGFKTVEGCYRLSAMVGFYDDFKAYAEDEEVKEIFKKFGDCKVLRSAKRFLDKKING